jgi:hypothetical protein
MCFEVGEAGSAPKDFKAVNGAPYRFRTITYIMSSCGNKPAVNKAVGACSNAAVHIMLVMLIKHSGQQGATDTCLPSDTNACLLLVTPADHEAVLLQHHRPVTVYVLQSVRVQQRESAYGANAAQPAIVTHVALIKHLPLVLMCWPLL